MSDGQRGEILARYHALTEDLKRRGLLDEARALLPQVQVIRDVLDHLLRVTEEIDIGRDLLAQAGEEQAESRIIGGVHFRRAWHDPYPLGRKSLAVNISDIAAMGGTPRFVYIGLACPGDTAVDRLDAFVAGVLAQAAGHEVVLVGGDTCRSPGPWIVAVTVEGSVPAGEAVGRDGAHPGDAVLVSGTLGDSALALALWQRGEVPEPFLAGRHCRPAPRVALGRELAAAGLATAMIDLSDGVASDLEHILQASATGAELLATALPLSPAFSACLMPSATPTERTARVARRLSKKPMAFRRRSPAASPGRPFSPIRSSGFW